MKTNSHKEYLQTFLAKTRLESHKNFISYSNVKMLSLITQERLSNIFVVSIFNEGKNLHTNCKI